MVPIDQLVENPKNANIHSEEQIQRLAKIIDFQGFRVPLTVSNRSGFVMAGHGRIEAAKRLGMAELPVIFQDFDNEAQEYAYLVSDNEIARWAKLDVDKFGLDIQDFEIDIELLGIEDYEAVEIEVLEPQCDEDDVPELKEDPVTKRGDVWLLGDHRLLCGDSTMIDDVEKLMNGEKADMVFTDPPYGMNLDADYSTMPEATSGTKPKKWDNIKGDHDDFSSELINTIFANFDYCEDIFICGADYFCEVFPDKNTGSWIVWDKRVTENFDRMIGSAFELIWSKKKLRPLAGFSVNTAGRSLMSRVNQLRKPQLLLFSSTMNGKRRDNIFANIRSIHNSCIRKPKPCQAIV